MADDPGTTTAQTPAVNQSPVTKASSSSAPSLTASITGGIARLIGSGLTRGEQVDLVVIEPGGRESPERGTVDDEGNVAFYVRCDEEGEYGASLRRGSEELSTASFSR